MKYRAVSVSTIAHIVTLPLNGILEIKRIEELRAEGLDGLSLIDGQDRNSEANTNTLEVLRRRWFADSDSRLGQLEVLALEDCMQVYSRSTQIYCHKRSRGRDDINQPWRRIDEIMLHADGRAPSGAQGRLGFCRRLARTGGS